MALKVASLCGYLCNVSIPWRKGARGDHDAHDWIQALKGKHFNGYAQVPVCGRLHRLADENASDAIQWFGEMAVAYLTTKNITGPFAIIPVPNSSSLVDSSAKPRTRKLAKAVVEHLPDNGGVVLDCLRFKQNQGSASSEGGPREAEKIYKNLVVLREEIAEFFENVEDGEDYYVLLVDDVTTSGGHLRACAARLKKAGLEVDSVICGGKTVYDQVKAAFDIREEELDEYEP
jgi:predicted amidophosphoribosyltransferase